MASRSRARSRSPTTSSSTWPLERSRSSRRALSPRCSPGRSRGGRGRGARRRSTRRSPPPPPQPSSTGRGITISAGSTATSSAREETPALRRTIVTTAAAAATTTTPIRPSIANRPSSTRPPRPAGPSAGTCAGPGSSPPGAAPPPLPTSPTRCSTRGRRPARRGCSGAGRCCCCRSCTLTLWFRGSRGSSWPASTAPTRRSWFPSRSRTSPRGSTRSGLVRIGGGAVLF